MPLPEVAARAERDAALAAHDKGRAHQQGEDLSMLIESWRKGIGDELKYWDSYFATKGLPSPHTLGEGLDPELPVQERVAALLPNKPPPLRMQVTPRLAAPAGASWADSTPALRQRWMN